MGLGYSCLIALVPNALARARRVGRGCPPPTNQPHQVVLTGWWGGWMGLGAAFEAVFMPGAQLIHSGPFLIQGVSATGKCNSQLHRLQFRM